MNILVSPVHITGCATAFRDFSFIRCCMWYSSDLISCSQKTWSFSWQKMWQSSWVSIVTLESLGVLRLDVPQDWKAHWTKSSRLEPSYLYNKIPLFSQEEIHLCCPCLPRSTWSFLQYCGRCLSEGLRQAAKVAWQEPPAAQHGEGQSSACGEEQSSAAVCVGHPSAVKCFCKRRRGLSCWTLSWQWVSNGPFLQRKPTVFWAVVEGVLPEGPGRGLFLSIQHWWGCSWSTGSCSKLPSPRGLWKCWRESNEGTKRECMNYLTGAPFL